MPASFYSGAAGICSSVGDLVRWERNLVEGTTGDGAKFAAMSTPAVLDDGTILNYGLGLHLDVMGETEAIFHEAGTIAFSSWLAYYPESDLILAVLSNTLGPNPTSIRDLVIDLRNAGLGS